MSLLLSLRQRGFSLSLDGERLFVSPTQLLTEADCAAIRENKAALVAALKLEQGLPTQEASEECPLDEWMASILPTMTWPAPAAGGSST